MSDWILFFAIFYLALLLFGNPKIEAVQVEEVEEVVEEEEVEEKEEEEKEDEKEEEEEKSVAQRLYEIESNLSTKFNLYKQMNRIEEMVQFIQKEKEKGSLEKRLEVFENELFEFSLSDFNHFRSAVYETVKKTNPTQTLKKIGKMWRELSNQEKLQYKF